MKVKSIPSTWLQTKGRRLDCGPFFSGGVEARLIIESLGVPKEPLCSLTEGGMDGIFHAGREGRMYVTDPKFGVPFLSSSSFLRADISDLPLLSRKQVDKNPHFRIRQGWTLISRSGTIGRSVYARPDMDGLACSEHVMRVAPDPSRIPPGYLYAYLSSRYGLPQVMEGVFGAIIQSLSPEHIANLPVPRLGEKIERQVHELVQQAAENYSSFSKAIVSATSLLLREVGLKELDSESWFEDRRNLGWPELRFSSETLRSMNYDPRAVEYWKLLEGRRFSHLGSLCVPEKFKGKNIFKRIDASPEYGRMLVGQKKAFQIRPEGRWISRTSIENQGLDVPAFSTLIPSHGTHGENELYCRAVFVTERTSKYVYSGDFFRCIPEPDRIPPGYLFAFLRSQIAFRMLRCISIGGKQQEQHPGLMWRLPIPRIDQRLECEISEMVGLGASKFDEGLRNEELAWTLVEQAISKGAD